MNKGFQVGWWLIVLSVAILFGGSYLFVDANSGYLMSSLIELGILIPVGLGTLYAKKSDGDICDILGFKKFSPKILIPAFLMTAGGQYFITYVTMPLQMVLVVMFGSETATSQMAVPQNLSEFLDVFAAICIIAPVIEELLCRGILMKLFSRYGSAAAVISSSLAFTLLHFEARSFFQIFFLGMLFGIFRLYTGSVFVTMLMHSFNNFLSLCQMMLLNDGEFGILTGILLFSAVLFPLVLYLTFTKERKHIGYINMTKEKTGFSTGALICAVLFVGYNLLLFLIRFLNGECLNEIYNMIGW